MPADPHADRIRAFLEPPRFATLATVGVHGQPAQAVIWFRPEPDGTILVNSRLGRRWPADLLRDGSVSLAVIDDHDPARWLGLSGRVVEVIDEVEQARDDIVALARRYGDGRVDPAAEAEFRSQPRISFRIAIDRVHDHLG
jgi:PPOX class probable F420-dependent enzyme